MGFLGSSLGEIQVNMRTCTYAGVFLIEGEGRHTLTYNKATAACEELGAVMASPDQVEEAYNKNMETCRNGWMNNETVAILRHSSHGNCAKNLTGLLMNPHVTPDQEWDAYCFNETAGPDKDCSQAFTGSENPSEPGELSTLPDTELLTPRESDVESTTETQLDVITEREETTVAPEEGDRETLTSAPVHSGEVTEVVLQENATLTPDAGSGMSPTGAEEEEGEAFTTAHVDNKEEEGIDLGIDLGPHQEDGETQAEAKGETTEIVPHPGKGRMNSVQDDAGHQSDSQESGSSSNWLVVFGVIVAVAAILLVCAAVAKRNTLCGKQQTLMITSKDAGDGNGTAMSASSSHAQEREQEMVTLMNKEKIQENGNTEEFTVITLEESPDKDQTA